MAAKIKGPLDLFDLEVPQTKTVNLGLYSQTGIQETFNLKNDMILVSKEDVRDMIQLVTVEAINEQLLQDNEPTRFLVDGSDGKNLRDVRQKTETYFGDTVDQLLITNFERTLRKMILKNTTPRTGNLSDMRNWDWYYLPFSANKKRGTAEKISNPREIKQWQYGDRLLIRPSQRIFNPRGKGYNYASVVNSRVAQRGQSYTPKRGKNKGVTSTNNHGYARQTIKALKRRAQFSGLTMYASFTQAFADPNEVYWAGPGKGPFTLIFVILNRGKRTSGRGYRNKFR